MFDRFPKSRPELPPKYKRVYNEYYKENREGRSTASALAQRMERWLHKKAAEDLRNETRPRATLEIGAGTLNHLSYEPHTAPYDIVEPFTYIFQDSPLLGRVRNIYRTIENVPLEAKYERIISIAALEHICNLPEVVARAGLLLREGGQFRVSIPSQGTLLWWIAWRLTTGLEFRIRRGLDYGVIMKHEHVNTAWEIEEVLRYFFAVVEDCVCGLSRTFSLYQFFACQAPHLNKCWDYLREVSSRGSREPEAL